MNSSQVNSWVSTLIKMIYCSAVLFSLPHLEKRRRLPRRRRRPRRRRQWYILP